MLKYRKKPHCISLEKAGIQKTPALECFHRDTWPCALPLLICACDGTLHLLGFIFFWPATDTTSTTSPSPLFTYPSLWAMMACWEGQSPDGKQREQAAACGANPAAAVVSPAAPRKGAERCCDSSQHRAHVKSCTTQIFFFFKIKQIPQ